MLGLCLGIVLAGCNKKDKFEEVAYSSVQIAYLRLLNPNSPDLSNTFFSIDQNEGKIYNANPISFYTKLDSAAIVMEVAEGNIVEIAQGADGVYKQLANKGMDSIWLGGANRDFKLKISTSDRAQSKEYHLVVNKYAYDPQTIIWKKEANSQLPQINFDNAQFVTLGGKLMLYYQNGGQMAMITANAKTPTVWAQETVTGFTKTMVQVVADDKKMYALNSDGALFESADGNAWTPMTQQTPVRALLGVFKIAGSQEPTLALLVDATPEELAVYTQYAGAKFTFATIQANKLHRHNVAPAAFPNQLFCALNVSAFDTQALRVVGGVSPAGPSSDVWYTTNGKDWLVQNNNSQVFKSTSRGSLVKGPGNAYYYYSFAEKNGGLQVSFSVDRGQTWQNGVHKVMLPNESDFGKRIAGTIAFSVAPAYDVFFLMGGSSATTTYHDIWSGKLKMSLE